MKIQSTKELISIHNQLINEGFKEEHQNALNDLLEKLSRNKMFISQLNCELSIYTWRDTSGVSFDIRDKDNYSIEILKYTYYLGDDY